MSLRNSLQEARLEKRIEKIDDVFIHDQAIVETNKIGKGRQRNKNLGLLTHFERCGYWGRL
jgi:hypothetical protein